MIIRNPLLYPTELRALDESTIATHSPRGQENWTHRFRRVIAYSGDHCHDSLTDHFIYSHLRNEHSAAMAKLITFGAGSDGSRV